MNVMIAGSLNFYDGDSISALNALRTLGEELNKGGFNILIGGDSIIVDEVMSRKVHGDIYRVPAGKVYSEVKESILDEMTSYADIIIFVAGNRVSAFGEKSLSSTVMEEFKLGLDKGKRLIPLSFSGYTASKIAKEMNFTKYDNLHFNTEAIKMVVSDLI